MPTEDTSYRPELVLEKIGGKWKMPILWRLSQKDVWRYGELKRDLGNISHKMLSQQLKELEQTGLITRTLYPVVPPKVEYQLTERGKLTLPAIAALCDLHAILEDKPPCTLSQ
ncbi:MAG TPA: helix-turn-helix domain-containing protein [Bacillota bacterium]|nr:helix-turn-helix domain-containing protein [Bacillota bacterium]